MAHAIMSIAAAFVAICAVARASLELSIGSDEDLTHFVTRPDIKAPILEVINYDSSVAPEYFFVAPYARIYQEKPADRYYEPCQIGPHIYDANGNLVWSGACDGTNENAADFRPVQYNGAFHLSGIRPGLYAEPKDDDGGATSYGFVLNGSYMAEAMIHPPAEAEFFDMSELKIVDNGRSALMIIRRPERRDLSAHPNTSRSRGWLGNAGFREVDVATGEVKFEWLALDHVNIADSMVPISHLSGPPPRAWDFFSPNSIDKSSDDDYLLSAQKMDAIYRISGKDGSVQWQLGGKSSSFQLQGFTFSHQSAARFLRQDELPFTSKRGAEYISFVDNAWDGTEARPQTSNTSSALIVELDLADMTARAIRQIAQPDGQVTTFGGNSDLLSNGHLLISWASNAYITEHDIRDEQDRLVMEARFLSGRFTTYRAYKGHFVGSPSEPPALQCTAFGTSAAMATTVCYVSWNGATEVRHWHFYSAVLPAQKSAEMLGSEEKWGFETRILIDGYVSSVYAEALDATGTVLGKSAGVEVQIAVDWSRTDDQKEL